jgi:hypothetical protein
MSILKLIPLLVLLGQEPFPVEDHYWLRFKVGTWIEHHLVAGNAAMSGEFVQRQTLAEKSGEDYVLKQSGTAAGKDLPPHERRSSLGKVIGKEAVTVDGKEYLCAKWETKGRTGMMDWEIISWMPKGNKYPLRIVTKQANFQGDLSAVALDEKVKIGEREYACAKLHGKVRYHGLDGVMTVWVSQEVPGGRTHFEMTLNGPNGESKTRLTPLRVHVEQ